MLNKQINLAGRTALVTGASRGIGEAAVRRLAKAGANVVLLARSQTEIEHIAQERVLLSSSYFDGRFIFLRLF